jgi:nucleolar protein 14
MRATKVTKKRAKFNLDDLYSDDEEAEEHLGGFTHGGRALKDIDDFQDDIPVSSEDENDDADQRQGKLNEEMVMTMNFGGGAPRQTEPTAADKAKTRKEVFEEIIAKSKAYKAAKFEVKEAAKELTQRLDD